MPGLIAALAILTCVGVALFALGWRGRRVNDHPICRKCGFDLVGATDDAERCPECGRDLGRRRAVLIGARRRRKGSVYTGMCLLAVSIVGAGALVWSKHTGFDWRDHAPLWVLKREARIGSQARAHAAIWELNDRATRSSNATEIHDWIVGHAMAAMRDKSIAFPPVLSVVMSDAIKAGDIRLEDAVALVIPQLLDPQLEVAPMGPDDQLLVRPAAAGNRGPELLRAVLTPASLSIDGVPVPLEEWADELFVSLSGESHSRLYQDLTLRFGRFANFSRSSPWIDLESHPSLLSPGRHVVTVCWQVELFAPFKAMAPETSRRFGSLVWQASVRSETMVEVGEVAPASPVTIVDDAMREQSVNWFRFEDSRSAAQVIKANARPIESGNSIEFAQRRNFERHPQADWMAYINMDFQAIADTPIPPYAFEIHFENEFGYWATSRMLPYMPLGGSAGGLGVTARGFRGDSVEVVLKPSRQIARREGLDRYWGEEIRLGPFPVVWTQRRPEDVSTSLEAGAID